MKTMMSNKDIHPNWMVVHQDGRDVFFVKERAVYLSPDGHKEIENYWKELNMIYTIKKSKFEDWGYEITARSGDYRFFNTAPSVEAAVRYLKDRFGSDVKIRIKEQ